MPSSFVRRRWGFAGPLVFLLSSFATQASATVFGAVRGVVHDPQHRPVSNAQVTLQANDSQFKLTEPTSSDGEFHFDAVPLGVYTVSVDVAGFAAQSQVLQLTSGSAPVMHFQLAIATAKSEVTVTASPDDLNPDSPRRDILIDKEQIS
ncbi:MAG TPA: carboxypeptidase-like regulatory domain-containing protein, partial [Candidatus Bathyarchaeia archaeon]|nr:carboxypeptidase-like regulatory domain-containing protein [Candidatus Bathyarchaeia archaeon]